MHCPICKGTKNIDVDTHSDGYASNIEECGDCGALWTEKIDQQTVLIHGATTSFFSL